MRIVGAEALPFLKDGCGQRGDLLLSSLHDGSLVAFVNHLGVLDAIEEPFRSTAKNDVCPSAQLVEQFRSNDLVLIPVGVLEQEGRGRRSGYGIVSDNGCGPPRSLGEVKDTRRARRCRGVGHSDDAIVRPDAPGHRSGRCTGIRHHVRSRVRADEGGTRKIFQSEPPGGTDCVVPGCGNQLERCAICNNKHDAIQFPVPRTHFAFGEGGQGKEQRKNHAAASFAQIG